MPAELGEQPVTLAMVAPGAGGDDVRPDVLPAARARSDVVDRVGARTAVHAAVRVTVEHRAAGQRHLAAVRHADVVGEAHDRSVRGSRRRAECMTSLPCFDDDGLLGEDEHDGAAQRHDAQRLVRRVEHQRPGHRITSDPVSEPDRCPVAHVSRCIPRYGVSCLVEKSP